MSPSVWPTVTEMLCSQVLLDVHVYDIESITSDSYMASNIASCVCKYLRYKTEVMEPMVSKLRANEKEKKAFLNSIMCLWLHRYRTPSWCGRS